MALTVSVDDGVVQFAAGIDENAHRIDGGVVCNAPLGNVAITIFIDDRIVRRAAV